MKTWMPIHDCVLIKPTPPDQMIGKFEILDSEKETKQEGTVLEVGTGIPLHNVKLNITADVNSDVVADLKALIILLKEGRPMKVKKGDYVMYGRYSGTKVKVDGNECIMIREADIFAVNQ